MNKSRIKLTDNMSTAIIKMCEGNIGAATALTEMLQPHYANIDPDNLLGPYSYILWLDTLRIYGTDIYVLYSDICNKDIPKMLAVLRATQLGLFSGAILKEAAHRQDYSGRKMVPVDDLYNKVKAKLKNFHVAE